MIEEGFPGARVPVEQLVAMIAPPNRSACEALVADHDRRLRAAAGSSHNHQAWTGGYWGHLSEVMNIAVVLHERLSALRALPFTLSDALLVLFLHDLEKPWRHGPDGPDESLRGKEAKASFRLEMIARYRFELGPEHLNALRYVEGEHEDYSPSARAMGRLAAFCHICDVASARLWPDHPLPSGDPWPAAEGPS